MDTYTSLTLESCAPHIQFNDARYNRILLERTDAYDIFLLCWKKGQQTCIHDHPEGGCWMRVLQGALEEQIVSYPDLVQQSSQILRTGDSGFKQGVSPLHSIHALEDSVSLHLYMPSNYKATVYNPASTCT